MEKKKTEDPVSSETETNLGQNVNAETDSENNQEKNDTTSPETKISELEDKLVRLYAEMENQRRRYEKEKDEAFEYGGFSFAKEALNLLDNLERSKMNIEKDESIQNSEALKKIINHLDIIYKDMISIFKKNDINFIESIGKKLDPNLHQAMMEVEDENEESGIIIQEIQKGFIMKDRLLRPALVAVSKKVNKKEQNSSENEEKKDEKK